MPKRPDSKLLTDVELELMTIIWHLGEGSVADVLDQAADRTGFGLHLCF